MPLLAFCGESGPPDARIPDFPASIDFAQVARAAERILNDFPRGKLLVEVSAACAKHGDRETSQTLARMAWNGSAK